MNNPPPVPLLSGDNDTDIRRLYWYLQQLVRWLSVGEPDPGWSVQGTVEQKTLVSGGSLLTAQDVLGTVIHVLQEKGILG